MNEKDLQIKGLILGADLKPEKVLNEICPECPFHTAFCDFRMGIWVKDPDMAFVCKGMRHWVTKSN